MVQLLFQPAYLMKIFAYQFTFHYGSITITSVQNRDYVFKIFTFHYGSITIRPLLYPTLSSFYNPFLSTLIFFTHFYLYTKNKFK